MAPFSLPVILHLGHHHLPVGPFPNGRRPEECFLPVAVDDFETGLSLCLKITFTYTENKKLVTLSHLGSKN